MSGISREEAAEIAAQYLQEHGQRFTAHKLLLWDEIPFRKPCLYNVTPDQTRGWVVYLDGPDTGFMLKSSDIMIISRDSGEVLYFGIANDEG